MKGIISFCSKAASSIRRILTQARAGDGRRQSVYELIAYKFKTNILLVSAIVLLFNNENSFAAASRHAHHRSPASSHTPAGGVMLRTPEPHSALEHNNRGVELGMKGLWPGAIAEHEAALQMDPWNKDFMQNLSGAHLRYGHVLMGKHDYYNAAVQFRKALYIDPANGPADEALDACIQAGNKKADPLNYSYRKGLAEAADEHQDYETAIVEWRKCVKMKDDGPAHAGLGRCLLKTGKDRDLVEGFAELKKAVAKSWEPKGNKELMRDLSRVHMQLADILKDFAYKARDSGRGTIGLKRLLNAGIEYRRAVTINPDNSDAIRGLIEVAREAVAMIPSFDNHMMLAGAYQLAGDFEHAKMEYEECWRADPNRGQLVAAQKSYHLSVARSPTATPAMVANTIEKVSKAVEKNPTDAEWLYVLGRARETQYEKSGAADDKQAAIIAYQKAASINKFINPDLKLALARLNGQSLEAAGAAGKETGTARQPVNAAAAGSAPAGTASDALACAPIERKLGSGDVDGAQKDLLALVGKNPKAGRAWLLLGNTYEKKGDLDQAIVSYRQAMLLNEPGAELALDGISSSRIAPLLAEADKQMAAGNLVPAAASLREAISIAPEKAMLYTKMALVLEKIGDKAEAEKMRQQATKLEKSQAGSSKK